MGNSGDQSRENWGGKKEEETKEEPGKK